MVESFENEVIDRLARIETEQKIIQEKILNVQVLESRVTKLEADLNQRKGRAVLFNSILILIGAGIGSIIATILGRLVS